MKPPDEFSDEYWKMRERMDWLTAGGISEDIGKAKLFLEDFLELYEKWHPVVKDRELRGGLEAGRKGMENLRMKLEKIFWAHLHEVIEARKDWWTSEQLLKASIAFINLMKHASPQMRPELEKIHRDFMKKEFEPVTYYQEAEAAAVEEEAKFRKALAGLEVDWPERLDAALRERLEKLDGTGANVWQTEVVAQQNAVK